MVAKHVCVECGVELAADYTQPLCPECQLWREIQKLDSEEPAPPAPPAASPAEDKIGLKLGNYRIEKRLGVGGMGVVYLARDLVLAGADPIRIARTLYFSTTASRLLLLGAALVNLKREGRLAWLWVTHQDVVRTCAVEEDCEGIVNFAISVGVEYKFSKKR